MNIQIINQEENDFQTELTHRYLIFVIDKQYYAFPITELREIIEIQEVSPVPEFPSYAKGIINIRGDIVPVIDVRLRFKKPEVEYTSRTCIIIVNSGSLNIGFIVDCVDEVIDIKGDDISPAPKLTSRAAKYVSGIGKVENKLIIVLDAEYLISDEDHTLFTQYLE